MDFCSSVIFSDNGEFRICANYCLSICLSLSRITPKVVMDKIFWVNMRRGPMC